MDEILYTAVSQLAGVACSFSDADLSQPYAWRKHGEGVRLALLGTAHELRDLAIQLSQERAQTGKPVTAVQRVLAQNHVGFRDLQAVLLGVTEEDYDREPAPGEWSLRDVLGHIVGAERWFCSLAHSGLTYKQDNETPPPLPDDAPDALLGPYALFHDLREGGSLAEMMAYYSQMHLRSWELFAAVTDEELAAPSPLWWESETYTIQYRLHRFEAHLRQHLIQAEKVVDQIGKPPTEARRLLRLVYNALAEAEGLTIGAPDVGLAGQQALAEVVQNRAAEITAVTQQARALETAVKSGDHAVVSAIVSARPPLVDAVDQNRLPLVLTATYHHQPEITRLLVAAGANLSIFSAAAVGDLERVQAHLQAWGGWLNEYHTDGFTPLQLACFFGQPEVALWLIEQGADVNAVAKNPMKITAVHATAANGSLTILRALLTKGADVNAQQQGGFTALHEAARADNAAMLQLCLEFGADSAITSDEGQTPLAQAQAAGSMAAVRCLQEILS